MTNLKTKFIAFIKHLLISSLVIGGFLIFLKLVWFKGALFELENVWQGFQILILVDVVLGPILTFIVYSKGKKSLKFDLSLIVLFQIIALLYGAQVIHGQRPVLFTFVGDRFETLIATDLIVENLPKSHFDSKLLNFPILTFAIPAGSASEQSEFITDNTQYHKIASRHRPIRGYIEEIKNQGLDPKKIKPNSQKSIKNFEAFKNENKDVEYILLPLQGTYENARIIAIDVRSGEAIEYLYLDPWTEYSY